MSIYEQALEEWKKRDPYLLDTEGFQRFLTEKEEKEKVIKGYADAYWERNKYCETKLFDIAIKAVLGSEFVFPPESWDEFFEMAHRYQQLARWKGYNPMVDAWGRAIGKDFGIEHMSEYEARKIWREVVKHPEWYYDWNTAIGAKGFTGSAHYLNCLLLICVKLGKEQEASELLNNLPVELRYLGDVPDHIQQYVIDKGWRKTYDKCKTCETLNCKECLDAP